MAPAQTQNLTSAGGLSARADQEQYYLLFMLPRILKALHAKFKNTDAPPLPDAMTINDHFERWFYRLILSKPSTNLGNSSMFRLFSNTKNLPILNKLSPALMSAIVPQVNLYKVFYKGENNPEFIFPIPFDTHTDEKSIDNILEAKRGGMVNANIESFNYSFIGTNPAEAENCLTATLNLKFQSIDALLAEWELHWDDAQKKLTFQPPIYRQSLTSNSTKPDTRIFKFSDLFNQEKKYQTTQAPNDKYYRIKAEIKYQLDRQIIKNINDENFNTDEQIEKLYNALEDTKHVLFLYHIGHDIKFEQDGKISVTINYRGAIEDILLDDAADLFLATSRGRALVQRIKAEKDRKLKETRDLQNSFLDRSKNCVNSESQQYKDKLKQLEEKESEEKKRIDAERALLHSEVMAELLGVGYNNNGSSGGFAYAKDNSIFEVNVVDQTLISREAGDSDTSKQITDPQVLAGNRQFGGFSGLINQNLYLDWVDTTYIAGLVKSLDAASGDSNDANIENILTIPADADKVQFMFLGDLLYTALGCLQNVGVKFPTKQDPQKNNAFIDGDYKDVPRFVFGNIAMLYPINYKDILKTTFGNSFMGVDEVTVGTRKYIMLNVNLAYLPVSINFFSKWFLNTVIKQKKTRYPIQVFLNELIELVRMSTMYVFENSIGSLLNSRLLGLGVSIDKSQIDEVPLVGEVPFDLLVNDKYYFHKPRNGVSAANDANLYIYYVQSLPMPNIKASAVDTNEKNGIFTFTIGKNTGLVKDISFQKQTIPFMQEARMTQEGELRRGVLRMKYNATISMYGSSLYRPGDVLIINPVFLSRFEGSDVQNVVLDELGLGGIYVVTKTDTDIAAGQHFTKLNCVFMAYGNGSLPLPEGSIDLVNCPPGG